MSLFLNKSDYTWTKAICWGNFAKHYELAGKESCSWGHRVIYILEALPLISQIVSIFEKFLAECYLNDSSQTETNKPNDNELPERIQMGGSKPNFGKPKRIQMGDNLIIDPKNEENIDLKNEKTIEENTQIMIDENASKLKEMEKNLEQINEGTQKIKGIFDKNASKLKEIEKKFEQDNDDTQKIKIMIDKNDSILDEIEKKFEQTPKSIEFKVSNQQELYDKFLNKLENYPNATELSIIGKEGETITLTEEMIDKLRLMKNFKILSLKNIHAGALLATDPSIKENPYAKLNKVSSTYEKLPLSAPKETDVNVQECVIELPSTWDDIAILKKDMKVKKLTIQGKVVNLLIMGGSNSGKSTLFEVLSGDLTPRGRNQMFVGTKDPTHRSAVFVRGEENNKETFQLNVLDSPGLNETVKSSSETGSRKNEDLLDLIQENNLKFFGGEKGFEKIDQVVLTCRMTSGLNNNDLKALTESLKYIQNNGYKGKPPIIVVTGAETLTLKAKVNMIQDFRKAIQEKHSDLLTIEILFSGVPNINDVEMKLQDTVGNQLKNCFMMEQKFVHNLFQQDIKDNLNFQSVRKDVLVDGGTVNKNEN